ncbi:MAG: hypothetical protein P0Y52_11935 [Candidatus Brevundimonas phytovorans]|nr:hypothetical protein [Brevundimonas sp.]WEK57246.1 MAG: hypothetical protein P0Y52_11935 [Brevundimonas sp.]
MRSTLLALLIVLTLAEGTAAQIRTDAEGRPIRDRTDPDLGGAVVEGIATSDSLWLRGASKQVVRFNRQTGERSVAALQVLDILADGPHLWALVGLDANQGVVRDLRDPDQPERRIYFEGSPVALFATNDGPGVLTTEKVLLPLADKWDRRPLAASVEPYAQVSALTDGMLFVGYNKGEWGGGLRRIDVSTGTISFVREAGANSCGGLISPDCTPVVGIITDTSTQGCILVGASLAHLSGRYGEVMRVCEDQISSVFADPLPIKPGSIVNRAGQTWPFNSLIATDDGWIAVGQNRFARSRNGTITTGDVPILRAWAGLQVSDPDDGLIFIEAACCWGSDTFVPYQMIAVPIGL